ncbi:TetR/AcrR family transcriptional regulator [Streptomyces sp. NPDC004749]
MSTTDSPRPGPAGRSSGADSTDANSIRRRLLDEAARVLAERGPAALSARRLVREVGASTMAVYTHFGSMPALVREVIREGFARFMERLKKVRTDDEDPVAELFALCRVYREFAVAEPHVYAVLFGGSGLAGFELDDSDRDMGVYVLRVPRDAIVRAMALGRFREADSWLVVRQLWCLLHGLSDLERTGYLRADHLGGGVGLGDFLELVLRDFAVGAGDTVEAATASLAESAGWNS